MSYLERQDPDDLSPRDHWQGLEYWDTLEQLAPAVQGGLMLASNRGALESFTSHWQQFHTALPYSEAERVWFFENVDLDLAEGENAAPEGRLNYETLIVSQGVYIPVAAQTLWAQWLAWRTGTQRYRHMDTVGLARDALAHAISVAEAGI